MLKHSTKILSLVALFTIAGIAFGGDKAHAASLTVSGGCTLDIAIASVNAGADQAGCTATVSPDAYSTNDKITIPAGTVTLTADLPSIAEPVIINGAGMEQTTIDGAGQYVAFTANGNIDVSFSDMKITAYKTHAIGTNQSNVVLNSIDVDGTNCFTSGVELDGIIIDNDGSGTNIFTADNLYIHDIVGDGPIVQLLNVDNHAGGAVTNATISNTTLANISNDAGSINGFLISDGPFGINSGTSTINATIYNTTIANFSAVGSVAAFGGFAMASGGDSNLHMTVQNVTSVGMRGHTSLYGSSAALFAAGAGLTGGSTASTTLDIENSLLADNLADGVNHSNCASFLDLTNLFQGSGTGTGVINSNGHNLSDDGTCTSFTGSGDHQSVTNLISTLGPLQNNGGLVPTMALLPGSPAIAAGGHVLGISTDARGIARPATNPDVGAFQTLGVSTNNSGGSSAGAGVGVPNTGLGGMSQRSGNMSNIYLLEATGLLYIASLIFVTKKNHAKTPH